MIDSRMAARTFAILLFTGSSIAWAVGRDMMPSRVPTEKMADARALINPLGNTPDVLEKGNALYHGKGACVNGHGQNGEGDGPVAASLNPAPRNFHHPGFWGHRTEGEIFWVIKHGVPGTAMIGFDGQLTDDEIWALVDMNGPSQKAMGRPAEWGRGEA